MSAQHRDRGEYHVLATTWREYARENTITLKNMMKGLLEEKVNIPLEVLVVINSVLAIFSGYEALKEHKEKFARLVVDAAVLIVIVWRESKDLPTSEFPSQYIERLNQTMISTKKLLTVKIKRNYVKRGMCILADLAKLKKYKGRIDSLAVELEHNVNISRILREVMTEDSRRSQSRRISIPEGGVEEIVCPEEDNSSTIAVELPNPQGANQSQTAKRSSRRPSHTDNVETDGFFGGEKGKKTTYTAEPEVEDDGVQGIFRKATGLHETTKRQGGELGCDASAKSLPKDMAKPGAERSQTTPFRKATGLHEITKRQGGKLGWDASAKSLPMDIARPGAERSQTTPSRLGSGPSSSISGFTFTTNGPGSIRNENVGVIHNYYDDA